METNYNPHSPWPQRDDELRKHCAWRGPNGEVMSGADVANRMGLRKGQVIGRARRLNVEIGVIRSDAKAPPETRQERRQRDLIKANDARLANAVEAVKRRGSFGSLPIKLATPITFQIWREKPKPERIHRAPMAHMPIPTHAAVITPEALLLPPPSRSTGAPPTRGALRKGLLLDRWTSKR